MCNTNHKRFYSPQFSELATVTVRRPAWALGVSMPKAVDEIIGFLPAVVDGSEICSKCQDKTRCKVCGFYFENISAKTLLTGA